MPEFFLLYEFSAPNLSKRSQNVSKSSTFSAVNPYQDWVLELEQNTSILFKYWYLCNKNKVISIGRTILIVIIFRHAALVPVAVVIDNQTDISEFVRIDKTLQI